MKTRKSSRDRVRQWAWLLVIWLASVCATGLMTLALKRLLQGAS
jgi:hypothetical protein